MSNKKLPTGGAPPDVVEHMMERAKRYFADHSGAFSPEVVEIASQTLEIYPSVPWSRHRTRLRAAFNQVIAGRRYDGETLRSARVALSRSLSWYSWY